MPHNKLERRIGYWKNQLLDSGRRNRMINYRHNSKSTLKITSPTFTEMFENIMHKKYGNSFRTLFESYSPGAETETVMLMKILGTPLYKETGNIFTEKGPAERTATLKNICDKAKVALNEHGVNVLFLSFGFLEWEEGRGQRSAFVKSPLVLVPVTLEQAYRYTPYTMQKSGDEIFTNPALSYILKTEHKITLPEINTEKPDISEYLSRVEELAQKHCWKVHREVSIGILPFHKMAMYKDIEANEDEILRHPIINSVWGDSTYSFDNTACADRLQYQVLPADSSQEQAILMAKNGYSFVLQGPPGTGKSSTIANIIAEAMGDGKKVLFVSEKKAALDVVYRNLERAGLSVFCLPLHSHRADKKAVLGSLGSALDFNGNGCNFTASDDDSFYSTRSALKSYTDELHKKIEPLGISCYDAYGRLGKLVNSPGLIFSIPDVMNTDESRLKEYAELLSSLSGIMPPEKHSVWSGLKNENNGFLFKEDMRTCLENVIDSYGKDTDPAVFIKWLDMQFDDCHKFSTMSPDDIKERLYRSLDEINALDSIMKFNELKVRAENIGLGAYFNAACEARDFSDPVNTFIKRFYYLWINSVIMSLPMLLDFSRTKIESDIEKLRLLEKERYSTSKNKIYHKLVQKNTIQNHFFNTIIIVNGIITGKYNNGYLNINNKIITDDSSNETEILRHELSKKRRIMPVRKLLSAIPRLIMKLKPCFMMSPLTVSDYLDPEIYKFDLVIFDEASQVFPEDAIGAILRSNQVIIAGDTKQLPPTSFFRSSENDEENEDIMSTSILEEAANKLPTFMLKWHYRSRSENLIAFSNHNMYDGRLITFPDPCVKMLDKGVEFVYTENGIYEEGGNNRNIAEAKKCAELLHSHIINYPDRSLGIVAFSRKQQKAIEEEVTAFREKNPQYDYFFNQDKNEPFFVKNLENIQGDERDTIIFSICYGKNADGKIHMRFGPLGRNGGERRLNVAITRAKYNVKLVGSFLPEEIDPDRVSSLGVLMLRSYIYYAIHGGFAFNGNEMRNDNFADIIAVFLEENGYTTKRNIGSSDYRIDIGILNPDDENEYIAGIECDGYNNYGSAVPEERDIIRSKILEESGWRLYRIWSTDWVRNTKKEKNALLEFIRGGIHERSNSYQSAITE